MTGRHNVLLFPGITGSKRKPRPRPAGLARVIPLTGSPAMRLTDDQVRAATAAMRERQEALSMGTAEIDALERLALSGDQGARLVVFQAYRRLVAPQPKKEAR